MAFTTSLDRPAAPLGIRDWIARQKDAHRVRRERHRAYLRLYGELSRLSNRELADIGLTRDEIADTARAHATA